MQIISDDIHQSRANIILALLYTQYGATDAEVGFQPISSERVLVQLVQPENPAPETTRGIKEFIDNLRAAREKYTSASDNGILFQNDPADNPMISFDIGSIIPLLRRICTSPEILKEINACILNQHLGAPKKYMH